MRILIMLFLLMACAIAEAAPVRHISLGEGEMTQVFVSPRFSTLIKFDAHPEPGLIGDQDAFKVEYMRNMVAVKPLVSKGKTNLFIFTKEGQFNFQLIATPDHHDNIVYVRRRYAPSPPDPKAPRITLIDDLLTRKVGKVARGGGATLKIESVATPPSRSTLVIKFQTETPGKIDRDHIQVKQGGQLVPLESVYLERGKTPKNEELVKVLLLIRTSALLKKMPVEFCLRLPLSKSPQACGLSVSFNADL